MSHPNPPDLEMSPRLLSELMDGKPIEFSHDTFPKGTLHGTINFVTREGDRFAMTILHIQFPGGEVHPQIGEIFVTQSMLGRISWADSTQSFVGRFQGIE